MVNLSIRPVKIDGKDFDTESVVTDTSSVLTLTCIFLLLLERSIN